ncbi:uncharacterized protein LOC133870276 [Alnus glutinosa]|uniref:uncharacterized protein LOC133870276 n=1 Tax=Alnus glutinosa TaxID=3517 RepID=UPI002D774194|nr:uncharacterized protein LOC133870276 [Alnus glutinosa]XP_062163349.1 uncharacterized protein LOC133870276 [Alnus glutinosa]
MATTKGKDSSNLGKEKRVTSPPNSRTAITKCRPKTPTTSTVHHKASSTTTEKQVPSYLRPTISSRHDQSLRYVKKSGPEAPSLNRRRSFETASPPASRLQSSFASPSPRERTVTVRSTSFSQKTTSSLKPVVERTSKTPKAGKSQLSYARVTKKRTSTPPATKKETNASASAIAPQDVDITENFSLDTEQDEEEFLVHEVEDINVEVEDPSEVAKCENDELSNVADSEVNKGEDEKVKLCDIPEVPEEKGNQTADIHESGDKLQEEKAENQPEGEENIGSNEIHLEESSVASDQATIDQVKEDKGEEGTAEDKESVDENKREENLEDEKEAVDGGSGEPILKEEENVEGVSVEETKSEVAADNIEISSKEEQNLDGGVDAVTKPEEANSTTAMSSKRQVGSAGKKESPPAYNDVIEETASKLLEKRKNKVKALVGAFETVIDKEASSK